MSAPSTSPKTHVFLVPGFFGFTNLGDFAYFSHAKETLELELRKRGSSAEGHPLDTLPTGSVRKRAAHLVSRIREHVDPGDAIHLIGHSTGGVDVRLVVSEGLDVPGRDAILGDIRTAISIASPHRGSPIAGFFSSILGQRLLRLLSLSTIHIIRLGSIPLPALLLLGGAVAGTGAFRWASGGVLDQVYQLVLRDFDAERRQQLEDFFNEAQKDQTLLLQLTPESMELVDALARPVPGVRYGCVVGLAPKPSMKVQRRLGANPTWQAMYAFYRGLHLITSAVPSAVEFTPTAEQAQALRAHLGRVPSRNDNDAMVPALSQLWGEVIHATVADHMDVMGHFHGPLDHPRHVDWMRTGSGFDVRRFEALFASVAGFITAE